MGAHGIKIEYRESFNRQHSLIELIIAGTYQTDNNNNNNSNINNNNNNNNNFLKNQEFRITRFYSFKLVFFLISGTDFE